MNALRFPSQNQTQVVDLPQPELGLQGSFDPPVRKGAEYELEFEDEYDSGTIARSEALFFARSRFVSINRLVES